MTEVKKRRNSVFFLVLVLFTVLLATNVWGVGTHINVTMFERVYQETSFAENFTLTEWQKFCYSEGTVNITNPGVEPVFDIYVSFTNTATLSTNFTWVATTKFGNQTSGQPGQTIVLYVPELRSGNYSTFTYNISCMGINPPVNLNTSYINADHGYNRKVLAGYNWTLNQSVTNDNAISMNITNLNITITAQNVTWNDTNFPFALQILEGLGDYANVNGNGTSNLTWWWTPNGGELAWHQNESIRYSIRAPYSVPFTATYLAVSERIEFEVDTLLSNMTILEINGSSNIEFEFEKRISQPADNIENHNVTWQIIPDISVPDNITFELNKVTLWVTQDQKPSNHTTGTQWGRLEVNYTGTPLKQINITTGWGNSSYHWFFNYTDGTNSTNPPPIVWMQPEWLITNRDAQIVNYSKSVSGNDIYLKYIYVVHGYWLEVAKNVTNIGEDQYQIDIYVENIGNGWTPNATYVTVYDFVPDEFAWWNMTNGGCPSTQCTNLSVGSTGDQFYGMSFRWNIPWKGTMNSSLGPKNGVDATSWDNYSWNVSYRVNGTGPYSVTELYIVGLDPLKVDGAYTSPIITIISGIQSFTNEILYVSVIAFLIIVNITNLIMTNRIHRKIQDRLPPAPPPKASHHHHYAHTRPPQ